VCGSRPHGGLQGRPIPPLAAALRRGSCCCWPPRSSRRTQESVPRPPALLRTTALSDAENVCGQTSASTSHLNAHISRTALAIAWRANESLSPPRNRLSRSMIWPLCGLPASLLVRAQNRLAADSRSLGKRPSQAHPDRLTRVLSLLPVSEQHV
jgi:hypothetical protein